MSWLYKISNLRLYHGSRKNLPVGTILTPQTDGYVFDKEWDVANAEKILEKHRPANKISRFESVFMVDNPKLIHDAGGYSDYIFVVEPIGQVDKSDSRWYTELYKRSESPMLPIRDLALNYWNGVPFNGSSSFFEYRARSARIIEIDPSSEMLQDIDNNELAQ